jgi:hypothetical protein
MTTPYLMEIDMSFYTTATRRFAATSYEVDDLRLDAGGLAGLVFIGQLYIEPDTSTYGESWYILEATASNDDGKTISIYNEKENPLIFAAIVKSVLANDRLCERISDEADEARE